MGFLVPQGLPARPLRDSVQLSGSALRALSSEPRSSPNSSNLGQLGIAKRLARRNLPCRSGWYFTNGKESRPFRCGSWRCKICGPKRAYRVRSGIGRKAQELGLVFFWTFTLPGKGAAVRGNPVLSRSALPQMWRALKEVLRRRLGRFSYIAVPEPQKDGTAHLHVVMSCWIPKEVLDEAWARLGGGFTWVERVDVQRSGNYLSKYLSKTWKTDAPWDERYLDDGGTLRYRSWRRWWESYDECRVLIARTSSGEWILVVASPWEFLEIREAEQPPPVHPLLLRLAIQAETWLRNQRRAGFPSILDGGPSDTMDSSEP